MLTMPGRHVDGAEVWLSHGNICTLQRQRPVMIYTILLQGTEYS